MKPLDLSDHRAVRKYLTDDDYVSSGQPYEPTGSISVADWDNLVLLPDTVALHTSDAYPKAFEVINRVGWAWLDIHDAIPDKTPMRSQALAAMEGFQGSTFNALFGWYRVAGVALRSAVEDVILGLYYQDLPSKYSEFESVVSGKQRSPGRNIVNAQLIKKVPQALLDTVNSFYQDELSVYVHRISEGFIWSSNGPVFVSSAFETWLEQYDRAFTLLCEAIQAVIPRAHTMAIVKATMKPSNPGNKD
jgi:hypothetical protein